MDILVIDGQGGGIGKNIVEKLKARMGNSINVIAVGTNSLATSAMIKGGADNIATGENAIIYNAKRADIIMGTVGIISANSMFGELTPDMAAAISQSEAAKILIPLKKCGLNIVGIKPQSLPELIDEAVDEAEKTVNFMAERHMGRHCKY